MYWPIGPAKAYEQQLPTHSALRSDDGLDGQEKPLVDADAIGSDVETPQSPPPDALNGIASPGASTNGEHVQRTDSHGQSLDRDDGSILDLAVSRTGHVFATITRTSLTVWQTRPTVILASVVRTNKSLQAYGPNVGLLLRPEADIVVIQSSLGFLITYSLVFEPNPRVYQIHLADGGRSARRKSSTIGSPKYGSKSRGLIVEGGGDIPETRLHFRMVMRLDAGISKALALDSELIVITGDPAAVQCIRWSPDKSGAHFSTELLSDMRWLEGQKTLSDVVYDRPMNLFAFVSKAGRAYAVQRVSPENKRPGVSPEALFDGHIFHVPKSDRDIAVKAAINSRFSLIALGRTDGSISLYNVQDYAGGVRLLQHLPTPASAVSAGRITSLCYSPDGYCLFVGYEKGWTTFSVYGQPGGSSLGCDAQHCQESGDLWLSGVLASYWTGGGTDVLLITPASNVVWSQEFARNAVTSCYTPANASKGLLQTSSGLIVYQGDQLTDLATITADASVWQHIAVPPYYLMDQWPLRLSVISPDRRYIAIAGQRGLAHYSLASGRWRVFQSSEEENDFTVRGGMCWHHHVLVAAVETSYGTHELRLYSRELPLESGKILHSEALSSPVVNLSTCGDDGVLVYTYENTLDHYIIDTKQKAAQLVKVGQIALSGIIRAPARVRAISWVVPDYQLQHGEASQDVASASVIFLVDGKLVLLQPSHSGDDGMRYDMRVIASSVEYFTLARDDPAIYAAIASGDLEGSTKLAENVLKDSLWAFDGHKVKVWPDIQELLRHDADTSIDISLDFYPFSSPLQKGLIAGAEAELTQRRDVNFAYFRTAARTTLFLPAIFRYYLTHYDISSALQLSIPFQSLPYFNHALEILLHSVLDEEVERPATAPSTPMHSRNNTANSAIDYLSSHAGSNHLNPDQPSFLPTVLAFLSNFPDNLDIILQCTRKTELRSWRTLFMYLPPPVQLFEQALQAGDLKTAGGYLLVLQQHQTEEEEENEEVADEVPVLPQAVRLLRRAQKAGEWDLCKELARFLMALDQTGGTLREALEMVQMEEGAEAVIGDGNGQRNVGELINGLREVEVDQVPCRSQTVSF